MNRPVGDILGERVPLTIVVSLAAALFSWVVAIPIGIYSAVRQYSLFDYVFTVIGFIGLATPSFLLALVVMWIAFSRFGVTAMGLFSSAVSRCPVELGASRGHAQASLAAHAHYRHEWHGLADPHYARQSARRAAPPVRESRRAPRASPRSRLLVKYPVRMAVNPLISTIGWLLPEVFSGSTLVAIVLNLQTVGPVLYEALISQDMYVAGSIVMILSALTIIGTLISDVMLAWVDPRIRFEGGAR